MSFAWPWVFLLAPLPLVWLARRPRGTSEGTAVPPLLAETLSELAGEQRRTGFPSLLLAWAAWLLLLLALAQPSMVTGAAVAPASGRAMVLAVDLSSSMERRDFVLEGDRVDRLEAFKRVAADFIEKRRGDRVGLVLFGDVAFSAAPVSFDLSGIANAMAEAEIAMAGRATAIGEAIGLSMVKLRPDPAEEKVILLMSDGTNNSGKVEPEDAAALARDLGIRIHTVGMGSVREDASGSPLDPSADLDEATLKRVSEISGGRFYRARTMDELQAIYDEIGRLEATEAEAPPFVPRADIRNFVLAALAAVLAALALVRFRGAPA